ncbi:MAG: dephospho-CoA kinase [Methylomarinum sp.]|nr:dephospho-CoA kinase [Methylomarinum sp.]
MLKIGLTGGIGSGKSTVAELFNSLYNIPVIDADIIAHQLVEPDQPALALLQQTFGQSIINPKGALDRDQLRDIIFSDSDKKDQLEKILHPLIYQQMQAEFDLQTSVYCILCIPLLMETKMTHFVDRVLVVDCPVEVQIERVMQRDSLSKESILSIIKSQVSRETRLSQANNVIHNPNSSTPLAEQVKKLHNQYILLSNS